MKKICIIGAGSGIGQALEKYYTQEGNQVTAITRDDIDLEIEKQRDNLGEIILKGGYDLVIFSAGAGYHKVFSRLSINEIRQQVLVNTLAPLEIVSKLKTGSKFVYLSSVMQYVPSKNMPVYAAMKSATSQTLASIESKSLGVKILSIDLGAVKTGMHIKAGMKKNIGKDLENVIPKLAYAIEKKQGNTTLFWDWWCAIYIVFPLYRLFLMCKNIGNKF